MANESLSGKVSSASVGEKLKKAREAKSLTVGQVQKQTHIYADVIIALEEGKADERLSPTYVKSFLKKYAGYLGLDADEIAKEYSSVSQEKTERPYAVSTGAVKGQPSSIVLKSIYAIGAIILIAVFLALISFIGKGIATSLKRLGKERQVSASSQHKKTTARKSQNPVKAASAPVKKAPAKKEPAKESARENEPFNLVLKTNWAVQVKASVDGAPIFDRVLPKGLVESFKARDKIELYIANGDAVDLILDGKPIALPAKGRISNLEVTSKGARLR